MVITYEDCVRCDGSFPWEQLTSTPAGDLFCPTCWQQLDAKQEAKRKCPVDGTEMQKRLVAGMVLIDTCAACGGTWFDRNELRVIEKKAADEGWGRGFFVGWLVG